MPLGLTPQQIEDWMVKDAANYITENSVFLYRFAANIPFEIVDFLLKRNKEGAFYFGSTLRASEFNGNDAYTLGFYTVIYSGVGEEFVIARNNYPLINFKTDWRKYINSSEYINLDLTVDNIFLDNINYSQALKLDDLYGTTQHLVYSNGNGILSRTALFRDNKIFDYESITFSNIGLYSAIPFDVYTQFNITPSIYKLAKYNPFSEIKQNAKKSKSIELEKKDIKYELL